MPKQPCRAALNAGHITAMTSCPWPRQRSPLGRLRDWWTPPTRLDHGVTAIKDTICEPNQRLWSTLMQGGFWQS